MMANSFDRDADPAHRVMTFCVVKSLRAPFLIPNRIQNTSGLGSK